MSGGRPLRTPPRACSEECGHRLSGRLRQRSYATKEGEKRTVYEIEVDEAGPSLRNASAKLTKAARSSPAASNAQPAGGDGSDDRWTAAPGDDSGFTDEPPFWAGRTAAS
jgi:single-strand DNA-binding protein